MRKLLTESNERSAAEAAFEQAELPGLVDHDITQPYQFSTFSFQTQELSKLQAIERSNFSTFQEVLKTTR